MSFLPDHVKFLFRHALIGFAIGIGAVVLLIAGDVGHLRSLIAASSESWLILGLLTFLFGLTFGSVQMGFAIMLMPYNEEEGEE